jgi:orotate phosphoribosyltransferase
MKIRAKVAQILLESRAVKISYENFFNWSSGWNSPIYCDNRVLLSYPEYRTYLKESLSAQIKENFPNVTAIVGVATAGIPMGALIADYLGLPYAYCRPEPKSHGLKKQLEGELAKDAKVIVFEDLISTGKSSIAVVNFLRENNYNILGVSAIFTYGFPKAKENFEKINCPTLTLSDYDQLIEEAIESNYIPKENLDSLKSWRTSPETWKK